MSIETRSSFDVCVSAVVVLSNEKDWFLTSGVSGLDWGLSSAFLLGVDCRVGGIWLSTGSSLLSNGLLKAVNEVPTVSDL